MADEGRSDVELGRIAERAMVENGFEPGFPPEVDAEVRAIGGPATASDASGASVRDLRAMPWSSIDNAESRDLDQVEVAEQLADGSIRVLVGIADVDALVPAHSALDERARHNGTSVYAGVKVFAMLPERLSTDLTSLAEGQDRLAVVIEVVVDARGTVTRHDVFRARVQNRAKLAYEDVGEWLATDAPATRPPAAGNDTPATPSSERPFDRLGTSSPGAERVPSWVHAQLRLQREAARRLKDERLRCGALELETIEARPVARDGRIVDLAVVHKNLARDLIEDFMIAANIAIAKFLEERGRSGIRRVVREPERWGRIVELAARYGATLPDTPDSPALARFLADRRAADPERFPDLSLSVVKLLGPGEYALDRPGKDPGGHFGLAAHDYSHATAPNRRYADLVTQRLVKATLAEAPAPYDDDTLAGLARQCTEREDAARKVERTVRKAAAATLLAGRVGDVFDAIVTGASPKGTYVRLLSPPAEGRVIRGARGMDVGDKVKVRLVGTDAEKGWIDLEGLQD